MTYPQNTGTSVMLLYLHVTIKTQPMNIILQLKKVIHVFTAEIERTCTTLFSNSQIQIFFKT